jgi:hypothetical protein
VCVALIAKCDDGWWWLRLYVVWFLTGLVPRRCWETHILWGGAATVLSLGWCSTQADNTIQFWFPSSRILPLVLFLLQISITDLAISSNLVPQYILHFGLHYNTPIFYLCFMGQSSNVLPSWVLYHYYPHQLKLWNRAGWCGGKALDLHSGGAQV